MSLREKQIYLVSLLLKYGYNKAIDRELLEVVKEMKRSEK